MKPERFQFGWFETAAIAVSVVLTVVVFAVHLH